MRNIEIKAGCPDPSATRDRVLALGARSAGVLVQRDTYFHAQHGRLKLREIEGSSAELIQYHRSDHSAPRASDYVVVIVDDPEPLRDALARALGIRAVVSKRRTLYLWEHTRIHLDEVEGLGSFIELETVITDQSEEEARAEIAVVIAALGVRDEDRIAASYVDLLTGAPNCIQSPPTTSPCQPAS